jgi:hypothetical protein
MTDTSRQTPVDPAAQAAADSTRQGKYVAYVVTVVLIAAVGLTVVLAFHYPKSSSTTAVLEVVVPIFTAAIGVVVGSSAGHLAGSAGKGIVQTQLNSTKSKLDVIRAEMLHVGPNTTSLFEDMKAQFPSRALDPHLTIRTDGDARVEDRVASMPAMDDITLRIGRIQGVLQDPS